MPVAGTSARGIWFVNVSPGGISLTPSVDGTIEIPVGGSAGFAWSADSPDGTKHAVGPVPIVLGTASFTFGGANRVAFAVYSADDGSLNFYKRMDIPEVGDTFEGKTVTAVYTGFETDVYGLSIEDNWNGPYTTPWYEYKDNILSVKVIDDGIEPANTRFWFGNLSNVESIDLSKIKTPKDQSDCYLDLFVNCKKLKHIDFGALASVSPIRMDSAFASCSSLKSVDLSRLDTSGTQNFAYLFQNCTSLEEIKGSDTLVNAGTNRIECMFENCKSLSSLDLSGWTVNSKMLYCLATFYGCNALTKVKVGRGFCVPADQHGNYAVLPVPSSDSISGADGKWYSVTTGRGYAPANIPADAADTYVASKELLPKVAFAVYSADDGSLGFYKRLLCDVPVGSSTFEGKTVTDVYTGVETDTYTGKWVDYKTDCPWSPHSSDVKSVRVVDAIRPKSISWWFTKFYNCTSFDGLDLIDTSECTSFQRAFSHCNQITELHGLDNWDTGNVTDISCIFDGCTQLSSIPGIDGWNVSKVEDCSQTFFNCQNLVHLDLSKWRLSPKENAQGVFAYCYLLEELDLSGFDFRGVSNEWTLFKNDYSLKKVTFGPNWKWVGTDGFLPAPAAEYIPGADGKWYSTTTGTGYAPADIPSGKADTYYASAILSAVAKDANGWTLDEQEAVAEDIAAKGDASPAYAKAKAAMDSGTTWSIALTNGETITYRIIGINHDDLADESGKAGLTFLTISHDIYSRMNATNSNAGGWEKSELRAKMNSGEIWNLMPSKFRDKVKTVTKFTNNIGGNNENCTVTATSDRLFLLSYSEIVETPYSGWSGYNWIGKEGSQYELFHNTVLENFSNNSIIAIGESWWERSTTPSYSTRFCNVNGEGDPSGSYDPTQSFCVLPAFCF